MRKMPMIHEALENVSQRARYSHEDAHERLMVILEDGAARLMADPV